MTASYLIFDDGSIYPGVSFGSPAVTFGTVVFTTSDVGYQETITNQIFHNQIIVFSQPTIGNTRINRNLYEAIEPTAKGVVVSDVAPADPENPETSLDIFLQRMNIPGITNVDTRAVVHKLRNAGRTLTGSIVPVPDAHAFDQLHATVLTNQQVAQVSTPKAYPNPDVGDSVVVVDFGLKNGVLRELSSRHCNVTVLPYTASADDILRLDPDGVVLSSGPGNPEDIKRSVVPMIQKIQRERPLMAIGLGHELFAMANGAKVVKMPIEHHGFNHPLQEVITDHVVYAAQDEGYTIDPDSVDRTKLFITYQDLQDGTVQGLRHRQYPAFSVQFSPDGAPGPDETDGLFDEFLELLHDREAHR